MTLHHKYKEIAETLSETPSGLFSSTAMIKKSMEEDECKFFIVYGPLRYGKTAYACKTLAQLHGTWDWNILKQYIVFRPIDFIQKIKNIRKLGKQLLLVWDDAGVWLNAMKWNAPLILAITRYLDVAGTDFAGIMFTAPFPQHIIKRVRGLPDCVTVKILKVNNNPRKPRIAKGYRMWMLPDLKKSLVQPVFEDHFSALMPNKFFAYYQKMRKGYTDEQYLEVERELYGFDETLKGGSNHAKDN